MIIDSHVSLDDKRFPAERAMQVLAAANIGSAVIFADAHAEDLDQQNQYVLEAARRYGAYPFYYVGGNPFTDTRPDELIVPDNLDEYAGIRWHRWVGTGIDREGRLDEDELQWAIGFMESPEFEAFAAALAHYNMPILFEESLAVTVELALRFPSLDIIVPHLGARSGGESNILAALWDQPHVYFDTSLATLDERTLGRVGSERVLFGSGYPYGDPDHELERIERLPIPDTAKEGIYGNNIESLLGTGVVD